MVKLVPITGLIAIAAVLSACSDNNPPSETNQNMAENTADRTVADTSGQGGALGLTMKQLGDAEILNASGIEIGEVERVITDSSGTVTHLLVEIEDSDPDRFVEIPLEGLTPKQVDDDWELESNLTREDLLALPEVK
ncbi:hypothetical protein [Parasphingorhabdus sp.]|uniref:hypothetical protein n=1 Tax=Parasphingorhabdus sp. TaxID=2709688 RepID=UPI002F93DDD3